MSGTNTGSKAGGPLAAALAGGGDRPLADRLEVVGWYTETVPLEGLRSDGQVVPSSAAAFDAAQPLGQGEGAFGLGAVCEEAAGLPAQRLPGWLALPIAQLPAPPTVG